MKSNNIFIDREALRTIDTFRIVYLLIAIIFFFITEAGRNIYRPFIYNNEINDFGIADSIGNLGGIIVQIFASLTLLNSPGIKAIRIIVFVIAGYIIYEILQPILPKGVFDWKDIYGTFLGGIVALMIYFLLNISIRNNHVIYKF